MARRNLTRTAAIALLALIAAIAVYWAYKHFYFSRAGGIPAVAIDPAKAIFKVSFSAPDGSPPRKLLLHPNYCFVPTPSTDVTVQVLHERKILEGDFSVFNPVQNATVTSSGKLFSFSAPAGECLTGIRFMPRAGPSFFLHMAVPLHEPDARKGSVDGVRIGSYPKVAKGPESVRAHPSAHVPPQYFLRLTDDNLDLKLAPVVTIGDLVCPTDEDDPTRHIHLAPVNYDLIFKIQSAWRLFHQKYPDVAEWRYISWFRTPTHNRREGGATYSRHIYADACDIIIDEDMDWRMDDLNGDGKIDKGDSVPLARLFEQLDAEGTVTPGGIGAYEYPGPTSTGAAIHVDVRGFKKRWGFSWMSGRRTLFRWYR